MKVDIVTSDDITIYNTGKFQDFTARYTIKKRLLLWKSTGSKSVKVKSRKKIAVSDITAGWWNYYH